MSETNVSETRPYRITDKAGFFVAGKRVPSRTDEDGNRVPVVGATIHLTDDEAKYELLQGSIEAGDEPASGAPLGQPAKKKTRTG